jgi:hypothetical protein
VNTSEMIQATNSLVKRLLDAGSSDVSALKIEGTELLRRLERDMSVHAVEHPGAAYSGTRAWYLLDEMFRHATLLGTVQAPTSSESLRTSAR